MPQPGGPAARAAGPPVCARSGPPPDIRIFTISKQPAVALPAGMPPVEEYYARGEYRPAHRRTVRAPGTAILTRARTGPPTTAIAKEQRR